MSSEYMYLTLRSCLLVYYPCMNMSIELPLSHWPSSSQSWPHALTETTWLWPLDCDCCKHRSCILSIFPNWTSTADLFDRKKSTPALACSTAFPPTKGKWSRTSLDDRWTDSGSLSNMVIIFDFVSSHDTCRKHRWSSSITSLLKPGCSTLAGSTRRCSMVVFGASKTEARNAEESKPSNFASLNTWALKSWSVLSRIASLSSWWLQLHHPCPQLLLLPH